MTSQESLFPGLPAPPDPSEARILESPLDSLLWSQIRECLFETMTEEFCSVSMSELEELIENDMYGVLVVMGGSLVNGVALLDVDAQRWVELTFVWSEGLTTLNRLLEGAEKIAKETGMRGVKWVMADKRSQAYAKRNGYRERLVEYVKEVK